MNIPYYTWDYMDYNIYIHMDSEPLTKRDAHPSIVSIQEAETYLHDIIDDGSTIISRFPALLSMMLYDWGLLYITIYIFYAHGYLKLFQIMFEHFWSPGQKRNLCKSMVT